MIGRAPDRATAFRISALAAVVALALLSVTEWSFPRLSWRKRPPSMELVIGEFRGGQGVLLDEVVTWSTGELRFAGSVPRPCHLFVFMLTPAGARRIGASDDAPGAPIAAGEFRIPGGYAFDFTPTWPTRFWAACGPADLRYQELVDAARAQVESEGSNPIEAVARADHLDALPDTVLQASRLVRLRY